VEEVPARRSLEDCDQKHTYLRLATARREAKRLSIRRAPKVYLPYSCAACGLLHIERRGDLEALP